MVQTYFAFSLCSLTVWNRTLPPQHGINNTHIAASRLTLQSRSFKTCCLQIFFLSQDYHRQEQLRTGNSSKTLESFKIPVLPPCPRFALTLVVRIKMIKISVVSSDDAPEPLPSTPSLSLLLLTHWSVHLLLCSCYPSAGCPSVLCQLV